VGARLPPEAQRAFGDANLAFVLGQTEDALQYFQEVIRMEPKHIPVRGLTLQANFCSHYFQAWNALATCYEQLGDHEKALQVEVMGAHLKSDADQWFQLGQKSRLGQFNNRRKQY
jgi:general transcription factor 3C polypeptide 3 (transcription factor C subunit 4)